ncbi:MAG: hypothetical protein RDU20_07475 [Desulfomonilaceae bacterium]|nr:hypothetical protein [Desulfomonilaceae bacterium]
MCLYGDQDGRLHTRPASLFRFRLTALLVLGPLLLTCSCTLISHSPYVTQVATVPVLNQSRGIISSPSGTVPYQKWRVPPWDEDMRHIWIVGDYDFRKFKDVELILYFHGMHSKDYYLAFRKELEQLAAKRPDRPFLFVGFVDTPYVSGPERGKNRWRFLMPEDGDRPERLMKTVNRIFRSFRTSFPHIAKGDTTVTLAGFSGGGRVLDAVGSWLARSPKGDPYADVFKSKLSKMAYFDCWFDKDVLFTVPALLENNPGMKIVGTVHMTKPRKHAELLAEKFKMKRRRMHDKMVGLGGRFVIFQDKSHWSAMISKLGEAL